MKDTSLQIQLLGHTPNMISTNKSTPRYIIIKYLKTKVLKTTSDKQHAIYNLIKLNKPFVIKVLNHTRKEGNILSLIKVYTNPIVTIILNIK